MSCTIHHSNRNQVVYITDDQTGEQSDPYQYEILANPDLAFNIDDFDWREVPYIYNMVMYFDEKRNDGYPITLRDDL